MVLEKILHSVRGAVSRRASEQPDANDAVFEVTPVNPEDILKRGHWKNSTGETIRINPEKGTIYEFPDGAESFVDLVNTETIRKKLEEGGFVFVPATVEKGMNAEEHASQDTLPQEMPVSTEGAVDEIMKHDESVEQALIGIEARVELITTALDEAREIVGRGPFSAMQPIIDELAARTTTVIEAVNQVSLEDDAASEAAHKEATFDAEFMAKKEKRLKRLGELSEEIGLLEQHASATLKSLKKLDAEASAHDMVPTVASVENTSSEIGHADSGKKRKSSGERRGNRGNGGDDGDDAEDDKLKRRGSKRNKGSDRTKLLAEKRHSDISPLETGNLGVLLEKQAVPPRSEPSRMEAAPEQNRKALEEFLQRPEGQEIIDTYRMILTGEWEKFTQALGRSKTRVPHDKAVDIWEQDARFLPLIRARIETDLAEKHGVTKDQASDIFLDILAGLDEEYLKKQQSQNSNF